MAAPRRPRATPSRRLEACSPDAAGARPGRHAARARTRMPYYVLSAAREPGAWRLGGIAALGGGWDLIIPGREVAPRLLHIHLHALGTPLDYSLAGRAGVPVLSERARQVLLALDGLGAQIDLHPVIVHGQASPACWYAMRIRRAADCLDASRSAWDAPDPMPPAAPDQCQLYGRFGRLRIDPERTPGLDLLRLHGAPQTILASTRVRDAFNAAGLTGAVFAAACERRRPHQHRELR